MDYFNSSQGTIDAAEAVEAATEYRFFLYTIIYFAVDCDPTGDEITSHIIPYFQAVNEAIASDDDKYQIGVYGTRNVCNQLAIQDLARSSFVAGMSTGYSGNLGFSLPQNWAFDQISTVAIGTGNSSIEIDNDIYSQRDTGQNSTRAPRPNAPIPILTIDGNFGPLTHAMFDYVIGAKLYTSDLGNDRNLIAEQMSTDEVVALQVYLDEYAPYENWKSYYDGGVSGWGTMAKLEHTGTFETATINALSNYIAYCAGVQSIAHTGELSGWQFYTSGNVNDRTFGWNMPGISTIQYWLNAAYDRTTMTQETGGQFYGNIPALPFP